MIRLDFAKFCTSFYLGLFVLLSSSNLLPIKAASSLAAWLIRSDGVLQFRTSEGAKLKAFYKAADQDVGDRIWIDFQGELIRPRTLPANGPIREIRLGKPSDGTTRFVIEFDQYISLDPSKLELVATASDKWELSFVGLPLRGLKQIGEGDVNKVVTRFLNSKNTKRTFSNEYFDISKLPYLENGKYLVVIDPGHGGPDPGAIGINGLRESEVVLDISKQVSSYLSKRGVIVRLTRSTEKDLDLPPRVVFANKLKANAFVSIHANASRGYKRNVNGMETYYYSKYSGGLPLAQSIQNEILKVAPETPDRGVRKARFFVIRHTNMPAALVEVGFVTGLNDARDLVQPDHRKKLAFAISKGILNYLKETD